MSLEDLTLTLEKHCRIALKRSKGSIDPEDVKRCVTALKRFLEDRNMLVTELEHELEQIGIRRDLAVNYLAKEALRLRQRMSRAATRRIHAEE